MSRSAEVTWGTEGGCKVWLPQGVVRLRVAHVLRASHGPALGPACWHLPAMARQQQASSTSRSPSLPCPACPAPAPHSLVMKETNSERHSCTVSLASLAILALAGSTRFMMRLMLAMGR